MLILLRIAYRPIAIKKLLILYDFRIMSTILEPEKSIEALIGLGIIILATILDITLSFSTVFAAVLVAIVLLLFSV